MGTPVSHGRQMSEGLRARLKRCGRSYTSPAPAKRHCTMTLKDSENPPHSQPDCDGSTKERDCEAHHRSMEASTTSTIAHSQANCNQGNQSGLETNASTVAQPHNIHSHGNQSEMEEDNQDPCRRLEEEFSQSGDAKCEGDYTCVKGIRTPMHTCKVDNNAVINKENERCQLMKEIKEKEEKLRKLKMVKMYRNKNNLHELSQLTEKWRSLCQELLLRLHSLTLEPRPTLRQLVSHLQIEPSMVRFNPEDESFS